VVVIAAAMAVDKAASAAIAATVNFQSPVFTGR
jgi:hypothetical protein